MAESFWAKVDAQGDCWDWTGAIRADGYGAYKRRGKNYTAHRFAFMELVGSLDAGVPLDHLCRRRACVNPDHLQPVTTRENTMRGGSHVARQASATSCVNGHAFNAANTYIRRDGRGRQCRACARQRTASWRNERRER